MERLRDSLHFIDQDEDDEEEDEEEAPTKKSNHVVFVDSQDEGMGCMCIRFDCMLIPFFDAQPKSSILSSISTQYLNLSIANSIDHVLRH